MHEGEREGGGGGGGEERSEGRELDREGGRWRELG